MLVALGLAVAVVILIVAAFVYPGHDPRPNELPVSVVGTGTAAADSLAAELDRDEFAVTAAEDRAGAVAAIENRDSYAALIPAPRPELLVASAASPAVAAMLENLARERLGPDVGVTDLRPLGEGDPRGVTINLIVLPISITSIAAGVLGLVLVPGLASSWRLFWLAGVASLGGFSLALIVGPALGAVPGPLWQHAIAGGLAVFAVAAMTTALARRFGPPGIALAVLVFVVFANPASGAASAPELLPDPWSWAGQLLPAGALASGLREIAYFDPSGDDGWAVVLSAWAAAGALAMIAAGSRTKDRRRPLGKPEPPREVVHLGRFPRLC